MLLNQRTLVLSISWDFNRIRMHRREIWVMPLTCGVTDRGVMGGQHFRSSFSLKKQCWGNLEMVRQLADMALAQAPMPVEDQGGQGTIAQQPAQVRLSHAAFLHQVLKHGQWVMMLRVNVVVFPVIRFHHHR